MRGRPSKTGMPIRGRPLPAIRTPPPCPATSRRSTIRRRPQLLLHRRCRPRRPTPRQPIPRPPLPRRSRPARERPLLTVQERPPLTARLRTGRTDRSSFPWKRKAPRRIPASVRSLSSARRPCFPGRRISGGSSFSARDSSCWRRSWLLPDGEGEEGDRVRWIY